MSALQSPVKWPRPDVVLEWDFYEILNPIFQILGLNGFLKNPKENAVIYIGFLFERDPKIAKNTRLMGFSFHFLTFFFISFDGDFS